MVRLTHHVCERSGASCVSSFGTGINDLRFCCHILETVYPHTYSIGRNQYVSTFWLKIENHCNYCSELKRLKYKVHRRGASLLRRHDLPNLP